MALWHAEQSFTSQIQTGKVAFAVGAPSDHLAQNATASGTKLNYTFGKDEAAILISKKQIAIPIQVDSLSQGNKGMSYTVTPPSFAEGSIFAAATTSFVRVASAAECKVGAVDAGDGKFTRKPVSAAYSAEDVPPISEFWCLTASLSTAPGAGTYTNTATATANAVHGQVTTKLTATDSWWANVTSPSDPTKEPTHTIDFTFETFRPGK